MQFLMKTVQPTTNVSLHNYLFFYQEKKLTRKVMDYIENTRLGETVVKRNTVEE